MRGRPAWLDLLEDEHGELAVIEAAPSDDEDDGAGVELLDVDPTEAE